MKMKDGLLGMYVAIETDEETTEYRFIYRRTGHRYICQKLVAANSSFNGTKVFDTFEREVICASDLYENGTDMWADQKPEKIVANVQPIKK